MNLWERMETLRAIVDTARADDLNKVPETVRSRYESYAEAYFTIDAVKQMRQRLVGELRAGHPVTGYISADFGYGKTATSIYLWKRLLDDGFVAVPPFLLRSLGDAMWATYGWLKSQLQQRQPSLIKPLEELYQSKKGQSLDDLAREIASRQGIPEPKARVVVQEYIAQRRDITTARSLLEFLEAVTRLAQQVGYKGTVLFADEIQEFIRVEDTGTKDAIQTLSELIKGIRAMAVPLGLILSMPVTPTEAAIEEQAGDIMHRMRERGTALRLEDAYGRTFPRELWKYLCDSFGRGNEQSAVDEYTLEALGQICERKDLSNGPRTVISAFKRIAQHYRETRRPYTPIDLMDDYLQGLIVFEGREAKLTRTLRSLLEAPYVRGNASKEQAVKLLAAFPRGVDQRVGGELYPIIENLAEMGQWLGEHITQLPEGFALVGLQEEARRRPILDEIVRDFRRRWHYGYREEQKLQLAVVAFAEELIPLLFPQRSPGQYANFGGHRVLERFEQDARGVRYEVLEGSFERLYTRFPDRKVCISLGNEEKPLVYFRPPKDVDLDFRFFLETPGDPEVRVRIITTYQDPRIDIHLNLNRTFGRQFPPDLAFLRDIMLPEHTSALVLLGLSMRIWGWLKEHRETSEADRQMMESQRGTLHRYALQLLLPDASDPAKVELLGIQATGTGSHLIESLFEAKCAELYPDYRPLKRTKEWKQHLRRYRDVLSRRPLAERRGREPFITSKEEMAKTFGWTPATFENQSRPLQEMGLLKRQWGRGRGVEGEAQVEFLEHPLEKLLFKFLQAEGEDRTLFIGGQVRLVKSAIWSRLREKACQYGYLEEEAEEALELMILRQRVQREADGTVCEFAGGLDAQDLLHQAGELENRLNLLGPYFQDNLSTYKKLLEEARSYLATPKDEVLLDAAQRKLHELSVRLDEFTQHKTQTLAESFAQLARDLDQKITDLSPRELEAQVTGATDFVRQVDDARKDLQKQFAALRRKWEQEKETALQAQQKVSGETSEQSLIQGMEIFHQIQENRTRIEEQVRTLRSYLTGLQHWKEIVTRVTTLRDRLEPESALRQRLDEEITRAILDNFFIQGREALLDWERFKAEVHRIEVELTAEETRHRDQFLERKEQYETLLGTLLTQRTVQATFDPKDSEQSYHVLYQGVLRKLQDWLRDQQERARQIVNEWEYLIQERRITATGEHSEAVAILRELTTAATDLNIEKIAAWEEFQQYAVQLREIDERLKSIYQALERQRTQKEVPEEAEKPVLEVLTTSRRRSLEDLRRELGIPLDGLFGVLKSLYRKGHLEIEVRRRE